MKKILVLFLLFLSVNSFAQDTSYVVGYQNDGITQGRKDTFVSFALSHAVNNYLTGFGTIGSLPDTVRTYFSVDTSRTSGGAIYNSATGVFQIPKITGGGGGGSSTVQFDSSWLTATSHSTYKQKGVWIRDTTSGIPTGASPPPLIWQGYGNASAKYFWRISAGAPGHGLSFDYATDTTGAGNWTNTATFGYASGGITTTSPAGSVALNFGSGILSGTGVYFDGRGYGAIGSTSLFTGSIFSLTPTSGKWGIGLPKLTTDLRNTYPNSLYSGTIISGGSGYTTGTYSSKSFTTISGVGINGQGIFVVSGGAITSATVVAFTGKYYKAGDTLSVAAASVGGTGSGFTFLVTKTYGDLTDGNFYYDSTLSKPVWWDAHAHINRVVIDSTTISGNLTVSSASTLTLVAGQDYVFNGTTATYTLPAVGAIGRMNVINIKNRGTGSITLNSNTGSTLYTTSAQSTITIAAGAACQLLPDGNYFNVMYNQ